MARKGYLEGDAETGQIVGVRDPETGYSERPAHVSFDEAWLFIVTDDYEGQAMISIEALPQLRKALTNVAKAIASKKR